MGACNSFQAKMKTITIHIPDEIWIDLKTAGTVRLLSGTAYGIVDSFALRLIQVIDEGKIEHEFSRPKKDMSNPTNLPSEDCNSIKKSLLEMEEAFQNLAENETRADYRTVARHGDIVRSNTAILKVIRSIVDVLVKGKQP